MLGLHDPFPGDPQRAWQRRANPVLIALLHLGKGNRFVRPKVERLLACMKASSAPVKPAMLGTIGKEHFVKRLAAVGCEMQSFEYRRVMETEDNVPWVI